VYNLVDSLGSMQALGVDLVRLSPQSLHMVDVVAVFRDALSGTLGPTEARERMQPLMPAQSCNGYWYGRPGLDQVEDAVLAAGAVMEG
jgi:collagenase-like PrtC family protease